MNRLVTVAVLLAVLTAHTSPIYATTTTAVFTNTSLPASSSAAARVSTTTAVPVTTTATTAVPSTTVTTVSPSMAKYVCKDLNTDACRQLNASKQGYCNDVPLSKPICPRFCGHCPSVCYHCDNVVANISDCTTTKVCGQDQMCMIKRLSSTLDGHHEYQLSCEDKQVCDGPGLTFPFVGRRAIESRDVSVHCCKDDYCNYPKELRTTTTTTQVPVTIATRCSRDIMFMIDTSHRININGHQHHLTHNLQSSLQLVHDIVSQLTIGPYDNLVSLATFGRSVHSQWDLDDHYPKADLLKAIANVNQRVQFTSHGDLEDALNYLIKHVMESNHGDRKGYPNDVIIITDSSSSFHNSLLTSQLQRKSRDVIVISVGSQPGSVSQIATDSTNKIHVNSYTDLPSIGRRLLRLLCT